MFQKRFSIYVFNAFKRINKVIKVAVCDATAVDWKSIADLLKEFRIKAFLTS